jgi:uncharacterized protein (TIGR02594 family)
MTLDTLSRLVEENIECAPWMELAWNYYGVAETSGSESNSDIIDFYTSTTGRDYTIPVNPRRSHAASTLSSLNIVCTAQEGVASCSINARYKVNDSTLAWCSAFVNHIMIQAGHGGTHSLAARSWERWGTKLDKSSPMFGAIAVFSRQEIDTNETNGHSSYLGHVGFYVGHNGTSHIEVLGGNQGNRVCVKSYPINSGKYRLLTYRWPTAAIIQ